MKTDAEVMDFAARVVWAAIPATVDAVLLTSPDSGRVYRVDVSGRCNCPAKGLCKHLRALELEYGSVDAGIADLTRTELPAALAAMPAQQIETVQPKRARISPKTFAADWGN